MPEQTQPRVITAGIGASAGGIEALESLLGQLKLDSIALVVVQHLAPGRDSALPALLARASGRPAVTAESGMKLEPNHIYVIPPGADLALLRGVLQVMPAAPDGVRLPVDYFFRSLAQDQGESAVGIVLSGTGTDGTLGIKAIKEAGGITFAQDPASAKFDGMPRSAMRSGFADFCLEPSAIAHKLADLARHPYIAGPAPAALEGRESIARLVVLIRTAYGNDLSHYKQAMVERRIERRMALQRIEDADEYLRFVQSNSNELDLLYRDMLIGVTSFFRDHDAFLALKDKVFPAMFGKLDRGALVRIWVAACSSGEEAYSVAISLLEYLEENPRDCRVQIFGTDIDERAIQHARRGRYPLNIALDVSPERLHRHFVKLGNDYQVARRLRDMVVFSAQNVTRDPPFSRLDLVCCRNLLIYLGPPAQKKVLRIFHYSLQPAGILMLGTSEAVGESAELFALIDRASKIYSKKQVPSVMPVELSPGLPALQKLMHPPGPQRRPASNVPALADRKVLDLHGPPGVVIGENLEIVHIRGRVSPYLEPMPGAPSFSILRLARPELHVDLRRAIHEASTSNELVRLPCQLVTDGELRRFDIEVVPLHDPDFKTRLLLVMFVEKKVEPLPPPTGEPVPSRGERVQALERELEATREFLQTTVEELESSNEELRSSNEELQSINEELQSTNEELESSKEELQSSNEELTTVNDELQERMGELQQSNDDLHNVMIGLGNAVVILDTGLRIRRYTPAAARLLNLIAGDIGRSVGQIDSFVGGERVQDLAAEVISSLVPIEREVVGTDRRWYAMSIVPYKTLDFSITGAVITLTDIETRKRRPGLGDDLVRYAGSLLGLFAHPLAIVDAKMLLVWANPAFHALVQPKEDAIGTPVLLLLGEEAAAVGVEVQRTLASGNPTCNLRVALPGGPVELTASRISPLGSGAPLLLLSLEKAR